MTNIAKGNRFGIGDTTTLADSSVVENLFKTR